MLWPGKRFTPLLTCSLTIRKEWKLQITAKNPMTLNLRTTGWISSVLHKRTVHWPVTYTHSLTSGPACWCNSTAHRLQVVSSPAVSAWPPPSPSAAHPHLFSCSADCEFPTKKTKTKTRPQYIQTVRASRQRATSIPLVYWKNRKRHISSWH